jgi:6-phosphogluconolactonase
MNSTLQILPDADSVVRLAAQIMVQRTEAAIAQRGRCTWLLSGGSTVGGIFDLLADPNGVAKSLDWKKVFLFWGDERFVEQSHPYNNFKLAADRLLSRIPRLPRENIFPVPVDAPTPTLAARQYAQTIQRFFGDGSTWPTFDIALNGMGPDGHTASLFPHSPALSVADEIAVMNHAGLAPWIDRVTLTLPVFNQARCVLFTVVGAAKADTLKNVLEGNPGVYLAPASGVKPINGELIWLVDQQAALKLAKEGKAS